jgi:drug/metabolite transporter (DMT)-like permease
LNSTAQPRPWLTDFVLLAAIWGASFLFTHLAVAEFGALPTAGMRVTIAAVFLLPILIARGHWTALATHWKKIFVLGMLNSGIPFALYAYALLTITTGLSALINATVPLFGALVAWLWLKDRPHGMKILGLLIGFVGVAMLAWSKASFRPDASGTATAWPVLACMAACMCYGISASFTKRYLGGVPSMAIATGSQLGASIGLAIPMVWLWPSRSPSVTAWAALLVVGVLCTGVAYVLFFRLIDKVGAAGSLTVTFLIPVFALIYGVIFLNETVTAWMLLCGAITLFGTALSVGLLNLWRVPRPQ